MYWAAAVCDVASPDALANMVELGTGLEGAPLDEGTLAALFQAHMVLQKLGAPAGGKITPVMAQTGLWAEPQVCPQQNALLAFAATWNDRADAEWAGAGLRSRDTYRGMCQVVATACNLRFLLASQPLIHYELARPASACRQAVDAARGTQLNGRFPGMTPPLQLLPQSVVTRGAAAWRARLAEARETPVRQTWLFSPSC
jgi:hypothetical protein